MCKAVQYLTIAQISKLTKEQRESLVMPVMSKKDLTAFAVATGEFVEQFYQKKFVAPKISKEEWKNCAKKEDVKKP